MRAVSIDFDSFRERMHQATQCLLAFLPCKARISCGNNGFHVLKFSVTETEYSTALVLKAKYDDPDRLLMDALRAKHGMTGNCLNNVACAPWIYTSDLYYPYFFCWHDIPGPDSPKLRHLLVKKFQLHWVKDAKIERNDSEGQIKLTDHHHFVYLRLNQDQTEVALELDGRKVTEFAAETDAGRLNIYCTWSDIKCIEHTFKKAEPWMELVNEKDVQSFLSGDHSALATSPCVEPISPERETKSDTQASSKKRRRSSGNNSLASFFWTMQFTIGREEPIYKTSVSHKDILVEEIDGQEYDAALTRIVTELNRLLKPCLARDVSIIAADPSEAITTERPERRKYELEIYDHYSKAFTSALSYWQGDIQTLMGNLPAQEIKAILKREGKWER